MLLAISFPYRMLGGNHGDGARVNGGGVGGVAGKLFGRKGAGARVDGGLGGKRGTFSH